jgi:hypothetical protein
MKWQYQPVNKGPVSWDIYLQPNIF